jgi:uroporphyrinogen decarboxylase
MNSLQRVLAQLGGAPVDRPAFSLLLSLHGARFTGASLLEHYSDPLVYAEGQCAAREAFGSDLVFSPFAIPHLAEAFGGTLHHHATQPPTLALPAYGSAREAVDASLPEPDGHPALRYLLGSMTRMAERLSGEAVLVGVMLSPADLPVMLLGAGTWMETLLFDRPLALELLERCGTFCTAFGNRLLAEGATVIGFTANFANPDLLPRKVIEATTLPALHRWCDGSQGPLVLHHGGCRLAPHLDLLRGLPQVVGYVVDARDSLAEGRLRVGEAPLLLGGLDGPALGSFDPEALRQRCREVLLAQREDPRFILATSGADIPLAASPRTLCAVQEALLEAGGGTP